jgi:hypothetical protein
MEVMMMMVITNHDFEFIIDIFYILGNKRFIYP